MHLSKTERLILTNQYRILEKLFPSESESYSQFQKILENGYQLHYCEIFQNINEEPMPREQSREVLDILNMYQEMNNCYDRLDDKSGIDPQDLKFPGFDGNNETELLSYARYYVEDLGRYSRLGITYFNSHHPTIEMYRRMLEEYRKATIAVQKDDVIRILAAGIHPDNR
jgi:uncharacterized protein YfbU (UPF0304 family)